MVAGSKVEVLTTRSLDHLARSRKRGNISDSEGDEDDALYLHLLASQDDKPDPLYIFVFEIFAILFAVSTLYMIAFHPEEIRISVERAFANIGHAEAQHIIGQRFMLGKGVDKNITLAMQWFKMAAEQGHTTAAYNLAVGHLKGYPSGIRTLEAQRFLKYAADHGLHQAKVAWNRLFHKE